MLLYNVVQVKNKCEWHPGKSRGADLDRHVVIQCRARENGIREGETDTKPPIQY